VIQVNNLTKYYGPRPAIQGITFDAQPGEVLGLLGPNAAGKTTTMRILTGYLPATSGTARVAGYDIERESLEARKQIGYLPENVPLYPEMTVHDYLSFVADLKCIPARAKKLRIDEAIELARITNVRNTIAGKLSRGYRQRVGIAQALIHRPKVVILDEPTIGLDPKQIIETRQLIKGLGGDHTVVLSSHILPEVSMTCSRVVIIADGKVEAVDTPENLTRRLQGSDRLRIQVRGPSEEVQAALLGVAGVTATRTAANSVVGAIALVVECLPGMDVRERVAAAIVGRGWGLLELHSFGMSLEDIFLKLTTKEEISY
jgi:ABC-2 type transport system ATP-binding protein